MQKFKVGQTVVIKKDFTARDFAKLNIPFGEKFLGKVGKIKSFEGDHVRFNEEMKDINNCYIIQFSMDPSGRKNFGCYYTFPQEYFEECGEKISSHPLTKIFL